jgi:hypothetical protein
MSEGHVGRTRSVMDGIEAPVSAGLHAQSK